MLIAEDEAVSRAILRRSVEKLGHECLAAENGQAALELYRSTPAIDLVISDWMMPGIDGPALCRLIREDKREGYTYFIFLTALGDKGHLLAGLAAGADDYLSKPLDRDELQVRLASAYRVTQLHKRLAGQYEQLEKLNERLFQESREDPQRRRRRPLPRGLEERERAAGASSRSTRRKNQAVTGSRSRAFQLISIS